MKQSDAAAESESNYKSKGVATPPLGPMSLVRLRVSFRLRWDVLPPPWPPPLADRGKGVPSFDEMVAIVLEEVDFDDLTTNVRRRRALAIAKPTPSGY